MNLDRRDAPLLFLVVLLPTAATSSVGVGLLSGIFHGVATWAVGWGALEHYLHSSDHKDAESRHMKHHKDPNNPNIRDVDLAAMKDRVFLYLLALLFCSGFSCALGNAVGLAVFYANYESVHRLSHISEDERELMFAHAPVNNKRWLLAMVKWHCKHHDAWGVNYGVTTPFWDIMAGTVSKKMQPIISEMRSQDPTMLSFMLPVSPVWAAQNWLDLNRRTSQETRGPITSEDS